MIRLEHHPLVQHKLALLRDRRPGTTIFKELIDEIAVLLACERTIALAREDTEVETPLAS